MKNLKGKVKATPRRGNGSQEGRGSIALFLSERHSSATLTLGNTLLSLYRRLVGPKVCVDGCLNCHPFPNPSPDNLVSSGLLYLPPQLGQK